MDNLQPPNKALQRTSPASPVPPLSFKTFGVSRLVAVGVVLSVGLGGCSAPAEAPGAERLLTPERYGEIQLHEGIWRLGFEINEFHPCGRPETLAVWGSASGQRDLVRERIGKVGSPDVPPAAFFLRSWGQISHAGHPEWKGERGLFVTDVLELRPAREGDCAPGSK